MDSGFRQNDNIVFKRNIDNNVFESIVIFMRAYFAPIIFSLIFMALAGAGNAAMDITQFHFNDSLFSKMDNERFYDPQLSWQNKWQDDSNGNVMPGRERFFGSSRWFVMFTDFWHCAKFFMIGFITLAVVTYRRRNGRIYMYLLDLVLLHMAFTCSFSLFYDNILKAKELPKPPIQAASIEICHSLA
jgi:hypothetical protein